MPRKPVPNQLPSLNQLIPAFRGFAAADNAASEIRRLLADAARQLQRRTETPFYPVREAAAFFGVPFKTVQRAYQHLAAEGLLRVVRGSGTMVRGTAGQSARPVLGVVGILIWLPGFLASPAGRELADALDAELRRRHYAADLIFYSSDDENRPELAERILAHEPDIVYWHAAPPWIQQTIGRLRDSGISLALLSDGKAHFPDEKYRLDIAGGFTEVFRDWYQTGLRQVILVHTASRLDEYQLRWARAAAENCGLTVESVTTGLTKLPRALRRGSFTSDMGIVFLSCQHLAALSLRHADGLVRLFAHARTLLSQGPADHPLFDEARPVVDLIEVDFRRIARAIACDISANRLVHPGVLRTFRTAYHPRRQLGQTAPRQYFVSAL